MRRRAITEPAADALALCADLACVDLPLCQDGACRCYLDGEAYPAACESRCDDVGCTGPRTCTADGSVCHFLVGDDAIGCVP